MSLGIMASGHMEAEAPGGEWSGDITLLFSTPNVGAATITSASFTPPANSIMFVQHSHSADGHTTVPDVQISNTGSLSFTRYVTEVRDFAGPNDIQGAMFVASVGGSPSSMTVTVDPFTTTNDAWQSMIGYAVTEAAILQGPAGRISPYDGATTHTTETISTTTSGNLVIAGFSSHTTGSTAATAPSGFTTLAAQDTNYQINSVFYDTDYVGTTVTCSDLGESMYVTSSWITELEGTSGPPFSPSDIADLIVWLDASTLSLTNGDPVSTWNDSSSGGTNDATQSGSARPIYIASGLNSLPTVRFDGTDDYLTMPSGFSTWTAGFVWFFVAKPAATPTNNEKFLSFSSGGTRVIACGRNASTSEGILFSYNSSDTVRYFFSSTGFSPASTGAVYSFHNPAGSADAAVTGEMRKDNVSFGTGNTYVPPVVTRPNAFIGVSWFGPEYYNGDFSEILIYNRALTEGEITDVYDYLNGKYGL